MSLASGTTFAEYTILRMLGFGGMGEVYLAQHPTLTRYDALKVLPAALTADTEFRERFTRETEAVTTLYHPHIVDVHARGEFDGRLWIAMDYVDGINAAQLVAEGHPGGMPAGDVLAIVAAVAAALDYAHRRGLLHRAVKPSNILLTNPQAGEQRILLSDFGITRYPGQPGYAAPEQLLSADIDGRADQYGLAATAYHLFTGAPPDQSPRLSARRPELARLDDVLARALAKNPRDRFGRCGDFAAALIERAGGWTGERSPEAALAVVDYPDDAEPVAPTRRPRPWLLPAAAAVAVLLLLTGLLAGFLLGRTNHPTVTQAGPSSTVRAPAALPTTTTTAPVMPARDQLLDGTYQVDINRSQQTFNDNPDPQPPDVTTWWAFRSWCTSAGCVAAGTQLDDNDHRTASNPGGTLTLDFRQGAWQSRPETLRFPCIGPKGTADSETTTQVLSLQPQIHGPLRGVMTVTVETDECAQQGGRITIPAVAGRVGAAPPDVTIPGPGAATDTAAPPTTGPAAPSTESPAAPPSTPGR
ncbi:serine/threonine-protein kinase PknI [Mycobacterium sp. MFM001]|uniref:serine/threonine-protein kinase n=1 Tax=Mycobacterium sp. MFM001 TaxID=2049453 RepID=UPI000DA58B04|nr:serine/threonine-protein kinase [Mycobacterium sp. MFM001]GBE66425.1 serine/threonine-protein kinase PknI [Mycobacterium sp. MFM001]